ncbi:MAG TPA: O-antigen ligase family protein [Solirubrobacteraceae bacterium]|nr:O-antigen ligase family protein [Solirubrobacteraceae bacterium]
MPAAEATGERMPPRVPARARRLDAYAWTLPGLLVVGLMLVWAVHDGGYDEDTWYWGALTLLALLAAIVLARGLRNIRVSRAGVVALGAFALYVAWSYLSITWAESPGDALTGSNRALLYLLLFATMLVLPWTVRGALTALLTFAVGVGVISIVLLFRLASSDHVANLIVAGRLAAPTGYFNSTAALFTIGALVAIALAARRELAAPARGALIAFAGAGLQLAVVVQSRGWLFTLPLVAVVALAVMPDRLRVAAAAVLPVAGALVPIHRLLAFYQHASGPALNHVASRAGHAALLICAAEFFVATLFCWGESLVSLPSPSAARRRAIGTVAAVLAVGAVAVGGVAATHGHPVRFVERQWDGFSHPQTSVSGSHFTDVGSSRYDYWRVSIDAFLAHPIVGLGQDNFDDYYVARRRTDEEPSYTHSLELRLLTHTGLVGFALFAAFMVAAIAAAIPARRRPGLAGFVAGASLLPLVVWLIHGSIDWFWEMPALTGPALGFLAMAGALGAPARAPDAAPEPSTVTARRGVRALAFTGGALLLVAAVAVLAFPYLSVREVSVASDLRKSDPAKSLSALDTAAQLNPLSPDPGRIGGTIALELGEYATAGNRFAQAISREHDDWFSWLGEGLAASALGRRTLARHDYRVAAALNPREPVIQHALAGVDGAHPLSPTDALQQVALAL